MAVDRHLFSLPSENDIRYINLVPTVHFEGVNLLPHDLFAHYPSVEGRRHEDDDWLSDYHALHQEPEVALEDDAYVGWDGCSPAFACGTAWLQAPDRARALLA